MKIFFTASLRGAKDFTKYYKEIYDTIEALGHKNLDHEIFQLSSKDYYDLIEKEGRKAYVDLYKRKIKNIQEADLCIFEASLHSSSIGFEIQKALELNTPTLVLYYDDNIPHFLIGADDDKLIVKSYNENNLKDILKAAIDELQEIRDKRFNFFISPRLLTYLEEASKKTGVTKSTFIRNLLNEHMKKSSKA